MKLERMMAWILEPMTLARWWERTSDTYCIRLNTHHSYRTDIQSIRCRHRNRSESQVEEPHQADTGDMDRYLSVCTCYRLSCRFRSCNLDSWHKRCHHINRLERQDTGCCQDTRADKDDRDIDLYLLELENMME